MAKMKMNTVEFPTNLSFATGDNPQLLGWASVNEPDDTYCTYSVEMIIDPTEQWIIDFIAELLEYENSMRAANGMDAVDLPSPFLTKNGDPRIDEDGMWRLRASGKSNKEDELRKGKVIPAHQRNKPQVFDAVGNKDSDICVWSGDTCNVIASVGFWRGSGDDYGTKLYLKKVQQVEAGPGRQDGGGFGDTTGGSEDSPF